MPEWIPVLSQSELPLNGFKAVEVAGQSLLVGRLHQNLFACVDRCPHAGAPLRLGKLRGEELMCARHGWIFNVITGVSVPDNPAFQLTQIPIKIDGDRVFVSL